jgi:integrase
MFASYRAGLSKEKTRNADWRWGPIADFWRSKPLSSIGPKTFKEFYSWRRKQVSGIKPHTLHKDVVLVRQVLKCAVENELLDRLPVVPRPGSIKANPRPWLTRPEWRHLLSISEQRIKEAGPRLRKQRQDLHDQMIFMVAAMVRVGEMLNLKFRDTRVHNAIMLAEVTGKRGTRTIVALQEACEIIERRFKEAGEDKNACVFPEHHREGFKQLLKAAGLYTDSFGFTRNMKSLRATAISFAILDSPNPNLLLIARNAGTSVQMIDMFYAKRLSSEMHAEALTTRTVPIRAFSVASEIWQGTAGDGG